MYMTLQLLLSRPGLCIRVTYPFWISWPPSPPPDQLHLHHLNYLETIFNNKNSLELYKSKNHKRWLSQRTI